MSAGLYVAVLFVALEERCAGVDHDQGHAADALNFLPNARG